MRPRSEHHGGDDWPEAGEGEQVRSQRAHNGSDRPLVLLGFDVEFERPTGQAASILAFCDS
jgi:hypothetical protein